jgi:hypothetical protein
MIAAVKGRSRRPFFRLNQKVLDPQRFASHWIVRSGQIQLKRAVDQLQAPALLATRRKLLQAPK